MESEMQQKTDKKEDTVEDLKSRFEKMKKMEEGEKRTETGKKDDTSEAVVKSRYEKLVHRVRDHLESYTNTSKPICKKLVSQLSGNFVLTACGLLLVILIYATSKEVFSTMKMGGAASFSVVAPNPSRLQVGCAVLLGNAPNKNANDIHSTKLCSAETGSTRSSLFEAGFAKSPQFHGKEGLAYVVTGPNTWVTLHDGEDTSVEHSLVIGPETSMDFSSAIGRSHVEDMKFVEVEYQASTVVQVHGKQDVGEYCAILYASNPYEMAATSGLALCADPLKGSAFKFSHDYIETKGYRIEDYSLGISFIATGKHSSLQCFRGKTFDKDSFSISRNKEVDLSKVFMSKKKKQSWNDKVLSCIMMLK